jgi:hypothetical protein
MAITKSSLSAIWWSSILTRYWIYLTQARRGMSQLRTRRD